MNRNSASSIPPITPSRSGSILLPPLTHISQPGSTINATNNNTTNNLTNHNNGSATNLMNLGQQQFWKVPYHEFQYQRRGSIDSLASDISVRPLNNQEQLLYNPTQQSPSNNTNANNPTNSGGSTSGASAGYWSFIKNSSSLGPTEDPEEQSRRSSSIPSLLRKPSNTLLLGQPQLPPPNISQNPSNNSGATVGNNQTQQQPLYPYSQFSQQQPASPSSFGQFAANGFQSRHGSIASEAMSPSTAPVYPNAPSNPKSSSLQQHHISQISNPEPTGIIPNPPDMAPTTKPEEENPKATSATRTLELDSNMESSDKNVKRRKRSYNSKKKYVRGSNSTGGSVHHRSNSRSKDTPISSMGSSMAATPSSMGQSSAIIYGQISDVDIIDTYYEFIHTGFPIIPLNKKTLTNDILLINTQPISDIHEVNNYVILWFRNSLELLVRLALKRKNGSHFYDNFPNGLNTNDENNGSNGNQSVGGGTINSPQKQTNDQSKDETNIEIQTIFITALNECFQKVVDIHPQFREKKDKISPKIKIIYLSTFILLNYILALVGYDNSFVCLLYTSRCV